MQISSRYTNLEAPSTIHLQLPREENEEEKHIEIRHISAEIEYTCLPRLPASVFVIPTPGQPAPFSWQAHPYAPEDVIYHPTKDLHVMSCSAFRYGIYVRPEGGAILNFLAKPLCYRVRYYYY